MYLRITWGFDGYVTEWKHIGGWLNFYGLLELKPSVLPRLLACVTRQRKKLTKNFSRSKEIRSSQKFCSMKLLVQSFESQILSDRILEEGCHMSREGKTSRRRHQLYVFSLPNK